MDTVTRSEIEQLYARLSAYADTGNPEAGNLFTVDGEFVAGPDTVTGSEAIAKHVAGLSGATTRHCVVNVILAPGDGDVREAAATALVAVDRDGDTALVAVDYKSRFQRTPDGWKFDRHEVAPVIRIQGAVA